MKNKLIEGVDFYFGEAGLMVMTAAYHLERGSCCGNGCKHCPYEFENVPEPDRMKLLQQRRNADGKNQK